MLTTEYNLICIEFCVHFIFEDCWSGDFSSLVLCKAQNSSTKLLIRFKKVYGESPNSWRIRRNFSTVRDDVLS